MPLIRKSFCCCCYMRTNNGTCHPTDIAWAASLVPPVMPSRLSLTKSFVRLHTKVVRMTTPVVTGDVESAHQRPQWWPGQSSLQLSVTVYAWWRHQMETFSALLALCAGNSPVPVNSPHKGQWRGALAFSFICAWINSWVNNREAGDLRCHRAHYDVIVMGICIWKFKVWSMFFLVITVLYAIPCCSGSHYRAIYNTVLCWVML